MHLYEILFLAIPEITKDEIQSLESHLDQLINKEKGTIISFERWGKYKLAYPIKKNDYGVYFLARFEVDSPQPLLDNIQSFLKIRLSNIIMRYMTSALSPKQSLAYQRPLSLEEIPERDIDSFLKEHKIEGLLSPMQPTRQSTPNNVEKKDFADQISESPKSKDTKNIETAELKKE